jgi:hypothetical protein
MADLALDEHRDLQMAACAGQGVAPDPDADWSLPGWIYRDPEFAALEMERIIRPSWQIVCHESDLDQPGAWRNLAIAAKTSLSCAARMAPCAPSTTFAATAPCAWWKGRRVARASWCAPITPGPMKPMAG